MARHTPVQLVRPAGMSDRKVATLVLLGHKEIHDEEGPVHRTLQSEPRIHGT